MEHPLFYRFGQVLCGLTGMVLVLGWIGLPISSRAQSAIPDGSLGTQVTPQATTELIQGGTQRGGNLFHSFAQFNVAEGGTAIFLTPTGISNILTRVTGSQPSQILGQLQTQSLTGGASPANLFLINPNGILFGANARLDLGGAFVGSTAHALQLGSGGRFSATAPETSLLLDVRPTAFLFNPALNPAASRPAPITILGGLSSSSGLQVLPGRSLLLVGGNITLTGGGQLLAPGGRVELASLAGTGTVNLEGEGWQLRLSELSGLTYSFRADVLLSDNANINVRGLGGGDIVIQANTFTARDGGQLIAGTNGMGDAGKIIIQADTVNLLGRALPDISTSDRLNLDVSGLSNDVGFDATGAGGNIEIRSRLLNVSNGAQISSLSFGTGNAGNILIWANQVNFAGATAAVNTFAGQGGNIAINTNSLNLTNEATIDASTFGSGAAGEISIQPLARNQPSQVNISESSGITSTAQAGIGSSGNIFIQTDILSLTSGGRISTSSFDLANAGTLTLQAQEIRLNQGVISATSASGQGGNINFEVSRLLTLSHASQISTTAGSANSGGGDGGNINFRNGFIVAFPGTAGGNAITANAFAGTGGNIQLTTQGIFGFNPTAGNLLSASSQLGLQGTITINRPEADPSQGLDALPATVTDITGLIAPNCASTVAGNNRFTVTGRGGLPANPREPLTPDALAVDLVPLPSQPTTSSPPMNPAQTKPTAQSNPTAQPTPAPLPPAATGWIISEQGLVSLVAEQTASAAVSPASCQLSSAGK